jgi:transposase-like protein
MQESAAQSYFDLLTLTKRESLMIKSDRFLKQKEIPHRKRRYDLASKRNFYKQWKASGLSKVKFAKQAGLAPSNFYKWCDQFSMEEDQLPTPPQSHFQTISIVKDNHDVLAYPEATTSIKLQLGDEVHVTLSMERHQLVLFMKELHDAINTAQ